MKIGFISLGCPKNQLDTEVMLHEVLQAGYEITPEDIDADVIIVMKNGAVMETGNHEELLEKKGVYYGLYQNQFAGFET